jgi:crotonobetainyl-CoA:carnitine CoA-transferase CaiB-like acyl-CoA transferase
VDPLEGIRVFDLTHALAGPYCTMLLGDLGADVIKIEAPGEGDHSRGWGPPFVKGESSYFLSVNRNKRSVALDLKSEAGRKAAVLLATACDVLVENLRPGTAARLGLGYEDLKRLHPGLVYCAISGFGQDRPSLAGYDQIVQGTAGLMSITGLPDGPPIKLGVPIGDIAAGMFGANAICAALYARERKGEGAFIDVAMQDSVMALLTYQGGRYFATGEAPAREGNQHPTIAPYGTYATADGFLNVAVGSDSQFEKFCAAIGEPGLARDARFASNRDRQARRQELNTEVEAALGRRTTAEWQAELERAGVPAGPILDLGQVFADPGVRARGVEVSVEHPDVGTWRMVGTPWQLDGAPFQVRRPPPRLGEHTAEVLADVAGLSDAQVRELLGD